MEKHPNENNSPLNQQSNTSSIPSQKVSLMRATTMTNGKCVTYVTVLFLINLLNYMDRFTIAGVLTDLQKYFDVGDAEGGLLQTVFIIFFMVFAPACGFLGDRYNRKFIMVAGLLVWIAAVLASSFVPANMFWVFVLLRGAVGVGEASYSTIAPTIIADLFVSTLRSRILMLFYFAIPIGSGLGFVAGTKAASMFGGWQWSIRVTPPLGLAAVLALVFLIHESERGLAEREQCNQQREQWQQQQRRASQSTADPKTNKPNEATIVVMREDAAEIVANLGDKTPNNNAGNNGKPPRVVNNASYIDDLFYLMERRSYIWLTVGYTAMLFVVGTLSWWAPTMIQHSLAAQQHLNATDLLPDATKNRTTFIFGIITCLSGFFGVSLGVVLAQMWKSGKGCFRCCRSSKADALVSAIGSLAATPLLWLGFHLIDKNLTAAWFVIFLAILMLCLNWAIVVDLLMYIIVPWRRNVANSWMIMLSHLFGDASGPYIVGVASDILRHRDTSPAARYHSLVISFRAVLVLLMLSGVAFLMTARHLPADMRAFESEMDDLRRVEKKTPDYKSTKNDSGSEYYNSMFEPD